jgi:CheY-like chemotaxis protein
MQWWPVIQSIFGFRLPMRWALAGRHGRRIGPSACAVSPGSAPTGDRTLQPVARTASVLQVLVVDDEPGNLQDAIDLLSQFDITPATACNGSKALALAGERQFDLILMDISMPEMDGLQAAHRIRQFESEHPERPRTTLVAYTTGRLLEDKALQAHAGFDEAMKKPCSAPQMQACLHRLRQADPEHLSSPPQGTSALARH